VQWFVADQDPQSGDLLLPGLQVEQAGQLGDVGVLEPKPPPTYGATM
jgi:hypothetical protein